MALEKLKSLISYELQYRRDFNRQSSDNMEAKLNEQLIGYPKNHNYQVRGSRLIPCFRLYERHRAIECLYPNPLKSFLDVGCSKGFYVLKAALDQRDGQNRLGCQNAVGIDVHAPFTSVSKRVKKHLKVHRASFYHASLDQVSRDPESFGGPFQTILMLSCYHYFFWGSEYCASAYHSHDEILARLAQLCTGTLLLSGRLEFDRLPSGVQKRIRPSKRRRIYNVDDFVKSAETFFDLEIAGYFGRNAVFVMKKKGIH